MLQLQNMLTKPYPGYDAVLSFVQTHPNFSHVDMERLINNDDLLAINLITQREQQYQVQLSKHDAQRTFDIIKSARIIYHG